jgi:Icc-related predicted phosphoesterase
VHFSDWHGEGQQLPEADLYICTGDMYPDYYGYRSMSTEMAQHESSLEFSEFLPCDAPVVCIRGNHDMRPIKDLFRRSLRVYEIDSSRVSILVRVPVLKNTLKIGGFWGIRNIHPIGKDVIQDVILAKRVESLAYDLDVLITHLPPAGLLSSCGRYDHGLSELRTYLFDHKPKLHCFGHVHESFGLDKFRDTIVSNAATGFNVINL